VSPTDLQHLCCKATITKVFKYQKGNSFQVTKTSLAMEGKNTATLLVTSVEQSVTADFTDVNTISVGQLTKTYNQPLMTIKNMG